MKILRWLVAFVVMVVMVAAVAGWQRVQQLRAENELLRTELQRLKEQSSAAAAAQAKQQEEELQRLRAEAKDVFKLRGEVSQLRSAAKEAETLRARNEQLRAQNQQSRPGAGAAAPASVAPVASLAQFPRDSWTFAGYSTPEAALVSAVWAMKEGKPQVFLDSLSAEEQARMAKAWENKSEDEIATKHQQDVSQITGVRVTGRQEIASDEVRLSVFIEGPGRSEIVTMK